MKTYEDCLDELAKSKGWRDWDELFQHQFIGTTVYDGIIITYTKEAALLYGEAKWNEACEIQREIIWKTLSRKTHTDLKHGDSVELQHIVRATYNLTPKPPFKP